MLLPIFDPFGRAASEETIFLEIDQSETRIAFGRSSIKIAHLVLIC
jgi:hypothetical protein